MTAINTEKIKADIAFWDRVCERCKNDQGNKEGVIYYTGFVDGMKEVLSYIETGKMGSTIEIETMIKGQEIKREDLD